MGINPPDYECPKCGYGGWLGPVYDAGEKDEGESLIYSCGRCRYEVTTATLDAGEDEEEPNGA